MNKCKTCRHGYPHIECVNCGTDFVNYAPKKPIELIGIERLATYEDTGLSPEEVAELAKAKTDDLVNAYNDGYKQGKEDAAVRGEWTTNSDYPDTVICSLCGWRESVWWADKGTNYCPNCGANMALEDSTKEQLNL